MTQLILASSSPRRRELLTAAGYEFTLTPPDDAAESGVEESVGPERFVAELARRKGADVAARVATAEAVVLAADTVAECGGVILGKPRDEPHAREMLTRLSGREHKVLTGVALTVLAGGVAGAPHVEVVTTRLTMAPLGDDWLEPYLATGGWRGKAGAFGFQDGLDFVRILEGSESNVVGLPMERVETLLGERGCFPRRGGQP